MPPGEPVETTVDGSLVRATVHGDAEDGILLLHGLASERRELGSLPSLLAAAGFTTIAPDLRGHGASQGPRGVVSVDRVREDVLAWQDVLEARGCELSAICGHSLGGTWTLGVASELPLDAIACINSPASVRGELNALEIAGYKVAAKVHALAARLGKPDLAVPYKNGASDVLDDPETIAWMEREGIVQDAIPMANIDAFLAIDGPAWARNVTCPALVTRATRDRVVGPEGPAAIRDALAGEVTFLELEGPHSSFLGPGSEAHARTVAEWFTDTLG